VVGVLIGTAAVARVSQWGRGVLAAAVLMPAGGNPVNDYCDYRPGLR
jgi:1,4-dihydroxy-2-naphthoate octaprenyltransferase